MQLLQKLLLIALLPKNKQLQISILQHAIDKLQTMCFPHGAIGTSTLCQVHKAIHLPVMLQSFVDTTKQLQGNRKGIQIWCYARARLISCRSSLNNFTPFGAKLPTWERNSLVPVAAIQTAVGAQQGSRTSCSV